MLMGLLRGAAPIAWEPAGPPGLSNKAMLSGVVAALWPTAHPGIRQSR